MDDQTCKTCAHFHQHYTLEPSRCSPIPCGHCSFPRLKHRKPHTTACKHYLQADIKSLPDREKVLAFLTVDMLQHIMQLSLPPIVEDLE